MTIIIPAHNEEKVIGRCLRALIDGSDAAKLQVIVACNGCTDSTAQVARNFGSPVEVIEIARASKPAALNAAERYASYYPRLYVDADVVLPWRSACRLAAYLDSTRYLLVAPRPVTDTSRSDALVRAFYDVWTMLPYNQVMVGTGVFGISEQARSRFAKFPEIISDDGFVRSRFSPAERAAVPDATVTVYAPRTLADLVRVKTRVRVGAHELVRDYPNPVSSDTKSPIDILRALPWGWTLPYKALVYMSIAAYVRARAWRMSRSSDRYGWERDESSRLG